METSTGKTALITGATSGIGRELANLFAKDGYNLVLVARSDDSLQQLADGYAQQFGVKALPIAKDLSDLNAPEEIYQTTKEQGVHVDVLVNNAGFGEYGKFATETDLQKELDVIQVNVTALVYLTKLYAKDMVQRNEGKILMLGSIASVMPNPMMAVYGATKSFIYSFSEALRNELKDNNVSVTVLMPGATDTDFFNKAGAMNTVAQEMARSANPADVAKEGYDALMKGKDKVVAGFMNKLQVAAFHVLPDPVVAENARKLMKDKNEAEQEEGMSTVALGIGIAALAVAGLFLASAYRNASWYDKARYRYKANSAKRSAGNALASVVDSVAGAYHNSKAKVEEALV